MPPRRRSILAAMMAVAALVAVATPAGAQTPGTAAGGTVPPARLVAPLFSARRLPGFVRAPVGDARLTEAVRPIFAEAPPDSCITVTVGGRAIMRLNGDTPLVPASVNKVITAMAVLEHTSPDEPVATKVVAGAPVRDGVVEGSLWVVGGGDALLTTEGYRTTLKDQVVVDFADLAKRVAAAGVREVRGDVVGDESRYDGERSVPSWPDRYKGQDTVGPLSALVVNDGSSGYERSPEAPAKVRKQGDPASLAAATFKTLLEQQGIRVTGAPGVGRAPDNGTLLAEIRSTMADQVGEMLAYSDNTTAELLTKEVGRRVNGTGSTASGTAATKAVLDKAGLPTAGINLVDGSGLDEGNRLTCNLVVAALDKVGFDSAIGRGMPVAGRTGTLAKHLRGSPAEGKVHAKTGTLSKVTSLAGFVRTRQGETVTFSFIQNGLKLNSDLLDKLAELLYEYPQAPSLDDLVPPPLAPQG